MVITVLANSQVEFIDGRYSNKALDFDRDLLAIFLGGNELLSTQIKELASLGGKIGVELVHIPEHPSYIIFPTQGGLSCQSGDGPQKP